MQYANREDEAASFVHLNQQRRPLSRLDIFKAAVASGDGVATKITEALTAAGLRVAPHLNYISWKPGMVSNIGGIEASWNSHGPRITRAALLALGEALRGQVLRYAGSIFPGIAAVCADEMAKGQAFDADRWPCFIEMIREGEQDLWRSEIMQARAADPNLRFASASAAVFRAAWMDLCREMFEDAT